MSAAEIAAYIGAAAWIPQIAAWVYRWVTVPTLSIATEPAAEIAFTSYGPIFNVRMAFSAERKDLIIDGFQLRFVHQDGEVRVLRWTGIQENLGETRDATGAKQGEWMKDQIPIALKISTLSLIEKFVRFREARFDQASNPLMENLVEHFNYLKRTDPEGYVPKVLQSKQIFDLADAREKLFWWKPGRYQVTLEPSSPKKFSLSHSRYSFELSAADVGRLQQNIESLKTDLSNTINSNLDGFKPVPFNWNWVHTPLVKERK